MRYSAIATILVCACAATNEELPQGRTSSAKHDDYDTLRPSAIAVMPVEADNSKVRLGLRKAVYNRLFSKKYSCLRLDAVDKHTRDGVLDKTKLGWDAKFQIKVTGWKKYRGGRYFAATGEAQMIHVSGEVIWKGTFTDYPLEAEVMAGTAKIEKTIEGLASVIVREVPEHVVAAPPAR